MSGVVSRWLGSVEHLPEIAMQLAQQSRPAITDGVYTYSGIYYSANTLEQLRSNPTCTRRRGDSKAHRFCDGRTSLIKELSERAAQLQG